MAVDYVKTGTPARMTADLRPRKWPHFMEKEHKPAEQIYRSKKVLGQLYDQVDRVDFVPAFDKPFDRRILKAYNIGPKMLRDAAEVKQQYDAAMRRIMAQHEIKTEFEVWSTFVLQHSNDYNDFKFHEEIGRLSQSLKDQFRDECRRKARAQDLEDMLQFVAAMYYVTAQEMDLALSECRQMVMVGGVETPLRKMVASSMPLMSFPWLFPHYLGRIANGDHLVSNADASVALQGETKRTPPKKKPFANEGEDMVLETAEGITHRGENLVLFEEWVDVQTDSEEQSAAPKASSVLSSSSSDIEAISFSDRDLLSNHDSSEILHAEHRGNERLHMTAGSMSTRSTEAGQDLDGADTGPSQLFRGDEADVGTLSKVLTHSKSDTISHGVQDNFEVEHKAARLPLDDRYYPSHNNGSSDLPRAIEAAELQECSKERGLASALKPSTMGVKIADSRPTRTKSGSVNEDEWEESETDEDGAEEVEVRVDAKPSFIDRLSLLNLN